MDDGNNKSNAHFRVAIVGSGFSGLCMGIKLKEAGIDSFVILEKASEVGGTWRENTYPGCQCDVQSHLYSYSFEGNPNWSHKFAPWNEIQDYILDLTDKYELRPHIRFDHKVCEAALSPGCRPQASRSPPRGSSRAPWAPAAAPLPYGRD
jgi:cation diffusion facilitator CzcD-associated flavoprotein CzcO